MVKRVVFSSAGEIVNFRDAGFLGGIDEHIHTLKGEVESQPLIEFETHTLAQILAEFNAPEFIHYMSLDIEGGELEALKRFPFAQYRIGTIAVEHLYEEPRRPAIFQLLTSHGYILTRTAFHEDWYRYAGETRGKAPR